MFQKDKTTESLKDNGNDKGRIGEDNRRNAKGNALNRIEAIMRSNIKEPLNMDLNTNTGPYYRDYTYTDVLGGIRLGTASMEINARVIDVNLRDDNGSIDFPLDSVYDKYALTIPEQDTNLGNSVLLPGTNAMSFLRVDDLDDLMNDDWVLKPHPVTDDDLLSQLGKTYGTDRVLDHKLSGLYVFNNSDTIATTAASEFLLLAALEGKPCVDLTRSANRWRCVNGDISIFMVGKSLDEKRALVNRALMHPNSGYLHPSMSDEEIVQRINDFCSLAETLRAPFKSIMGQKFIAANTANGPIEEAAYVAPVMSRVNRQNRK